MAQTHDHGDHSHPAAPMVEEISEFEILEIAVRELAIEKGLFTAEDHRKFTEWAEQIGPAGGSRLVAKAWTDPAFKARVLSDGVAACREIGIDWGRTDRPGHAKRLHGAARPGRHADAAPRDRVHAVLLLSAAAARPLALLVPFAELPSPAGPLAAPGADRIRLGRAARGRDQGRGLESEMPLYGPPDAPCGNRELDRGAARGNRDARLHGRRRVAAAGPQGGRCPAGPQGQPAGRRRAP